MFRHVSANHCLLSEFRVRSLSKKMISPVIFDVDHSNGKMLFA